jgi:hypothetical protein
MKNFHFNGLIEPFLCNEPGKITLVLPIKTVSESNNHEHWTQKHKRHSYQKKKVAYYFLMLEEKPTLPCKIILTRIAPRSLDFDNLVSSQKWIRDAICDQLIPGLKPGRSDSDPRISISYAQQSAAPKKYGVKIEIQFHID